MTLFTEAASERVQKVAEHLQRMEYERMGWGDAAMVDVHRTALSWAHGIAFLHRASNVWVENGADGMSFGGTLPGGFTFGLIARPMPRTEPFTLHGWTWDVNS